MPKAKKIDPKTQARTAPSTNTPTIPNWPPLRPLLPAADLSLVPLVPDQIYLIQNFLSSSLCKTYASFLASLPLTTTPGKPKKDEAVRVNDRFQVQDARFAEMLWSGTALKELVTTRFADEETYNEDGEYEPLSAEELAKKAKEVWGGEPLGLNSNIRIYRYSTGQFFAQHYDESNSLTFLPQSATKACPARTTWTLLIYLTTCSGGETVFYPEPTRANRNPEPIAVAPEIGMALLHRHGDHCMLHEGMEVTGGEKWVLRSDLVVAR
ncbi:Prolyl 4-hydroxylase alpha subunit [Penicillium pulvis]|uniref:Prolyl 4-hydroxylase alpha subunit n=1 Tax=Penicillium pulvis TaxID=1562058 RepID=UPI002548CE2A|nr:Prolyl 4-hydroxylase alpha subunit [Penicillium pulvis]KAJ5792930.1 Prolyl 4-hydroxylase alpha subunit [Penicillium pulvis]